MTLYCDEDDAEEMGALAAVDDTRITTNPFSMKSDLGNAWSRGFGLGAYWRGRIEDKIINLPPMENKRNYIQ